MRILFVNYLYYPDITGGAARSVQALAEALAAKGHDVHVARFHQQRGKPSEVMNGVTVHYLTLRNIYWPYDGQKRPAWKRLLWHVLDTVNLWAMWDFNRLLKKLKPDVVNSSIIAGFSTGLFYVCKWQGVKMIHTLRDYYLMCPQVAMFKNGCNCTEICKACKPFAAIRKHALKRVDMVLSNSRFVAERHAKHGMFGKGQPVHTQYNINLLPIAAKPRVAPKGRPVRFGFIGKLSDTKGPEALLDAALKLPHTNWQVLVAGKGDARYEAHLKAKYKHPNITFVGWAEAAAFYADIDVMVCPSVYHDPLPRVVFEAYASGLPVIVANTGGMPEVVENGQTGYVVNPTDTLAMAAALESFCSGKADYAAMSKAALRAAETFLPDNVVARYEQRLAEVVHGTD